jgi:hypothetical protein
MASINKGEKVNMASHACDSSYLGGGGKRIASSVPVLAKHEI